MSSDEKKQKVLRYAEITLKGAQSPLAPDEIAEKERIARELGLSEREILDQAHTFMQRDY